jgi:hypothetical protein
MRRSADKISELMIASLSRFSEREQKRRIANVERIGASIRTPNHSRKNLIFNSRVNYW